MKSILLTALLALVLQAAPLRAEPSPEVETRVAGILAMQFKSIINCERCDLREANFDGQFQRLAAFQKTDLRGARFRRADITGIHLNRAKLDGATFSGANMAGAVLTGASLRGAEGPARAASGALASERAGGAGRGGAPAGAARGAPAAPAPLGGLCQRARCIAAQIRNSALPCGWWRNHSASVASRHASRTPANWGEPGGGHGGCAAAMASQRKTSTLLCCST